MSKSGSPMRCGGFCRRHWRAISRFMARFARRQQGTGRANCRLADVLSSAHVLDAAASMASSATFRGILLRAVSGCCYNNGGLRNRHWANAITKHGGKRQWQTSVQSLPNQYQCATVSSFPVQFGRTHTNQPNLVSPVAHINQASQKRMETPDFPKRLDTAQFRLISDQSQVRSRMSKPSQLCWV